MGVKFGTEEETKGPLLRAKNWHGGGDLSKMWNINAPQGRIPRRFSQNLQSLYQFQDVLAVKIWLDLLEGLGSYRGFNDNLYSLE